MKYILAALILCVSSVAMAGPQFNFNFGIKEYKYRTPRTYQYGYVERIYGYYDQNGNWITYKIRERAPERYYWHYGPAINFGFGPDERY